MKMTFESREEIRQIARILESMYPEAVTLSVEDLTIARQEHLNLPWDSDGFRIPVIFSNSAADTAQNSQPTEEMRAYLAGQLDICFRLMTTNRLQPQEAAALCGITTEYLMATQGSWVAMMDLSREAECC